MKKNHADDGFDDYNDMVIGRLVALTLTSHQRNQLTLAEKHQTPTQIYTSFKNQIAVINAKQHSR